MCLNESCMKKEHLPPGMEISDMESLLYSQGPSNGEISLITQISSYPFYGMLLFKMRNISHGFTQSLHFLHLYH